MESEALEAALQMTIKGRNIVVETGMKRRGKSTGLGFMHMG